MITAKVVNLHINDARLLDLICGRCGSLKNSMKDAGLFGPDRET
jgi:hypothetical protein